MNSIKKAIDRHNYLAALVFVILGLALMMILSACSTPRADAPDPKASAATIEESPEAEEEVSAPPVNNLVKQFGEVVTYEDGLSVSLSAPTQFTPTEYAQGVVEGQTPMIFKVVLTNGTEEPVDPYTYVTVSSAGAESGIIGDFGNPEVGDVGGFPTTAVLPGQTVEWLVGFSIADPSSITADVSTGFADSAIFTNIPF